MCVDSFSSAVGSVPHQQIHAFFVSAGIVQPCSKRVPRFVNRVGNTSQNTQFFETFAKCQIAHLQAQLINRDILLVCF